MHIKEQYQRLGGLSKSSSKKGTFYHSEVWFKIDDMANQFIQQKHPGATRYHHEPYNNAVVNVYKS